VEDFLSTCEAGDERKHGYYRAIRALYRFASRRLKQFNPVDALDPPKRLKKQPRILMPDELDQLLSYPHPAKVKAALLFLIDTGCRVGEIINLQVSDFNQTPFGYIARLSGKTGMRYVPVSYEVYQAMLRVLPFGWKKHWLGELITKGFKEANIQGSAHTIRHTFCTLWKGDVFALQRIVGHARIGTTQLYRHLQTEYLSEQHQQFSPLKMVYSRSKSML
jgi:integrase/recombinase XerD